jgi:hypothetical protein
VNEKMLPRLSRVQSRIDPNRLGAGCRCKNGVSVVGEGWMQRVVLAKDLCGKCLAREISRNDSDPAVR